MCTQDLGQMSPPPWPPHDVLFQFSWNNSDKFGPEHLRASVTHKISLRSLTGRNAECAGTGRCMAVRAVSGQLAGPIVCVGWGGCPSSPLFQGFPQSGPFSHFRFLLLPIHCITNYRVQSFYNSASHNVYRVHKDETDQKDQNSDSIRTCRMGVCGWKNNPECSFEKFCVTHTLDGIKSQTLMTWSSQVIFVYTITDFNDLE